MFPDSPVNAEELPEKKATKRKMPAKDTDEYRKRRDRNNVAVKLSRERSRAKAKETTEKVVRLKEENKQLEQKVQLLSKELSLLKDLFLAHAGGVPSRKSVKSDTHEVPEPYSPGIPVNDQAIENDHKYFSPGITA